MKSLWLIALMSIGAFAQEQTLGESEIKEMDMPEVVEFKFSAKEVPNTKLTEKRMKAEKWKSIRTFTELTVLYKDSDGITYQAPFTVMDSSFYPGPYSYSGSGELCEILTGEALEGLEKEYSAELLAHEDWSQALFDHQNFIPMFDVADRSLDLIPFNPLASKQVDRINNYGIVASVVCFTPSYELIIEGQKKSQNQEKKKETSVVTE